MTFDNEGVIFIESGTAFNLTLSEGVNNGVIDVGVDTLIFNGGSLSGGGTIGIEDLGKVEIASGSISNAIHFLGAGTLQLDTLGALGPSGSLSGLAIGDVIDFAHLAVTGGSYDDTSVTVTYAGGQETLALAAPLPSGDTFGLGPDGKGGWELTVEALCFMAGTMIRTPGGEVAVETLKRGDLVVTADGRTAPAAWIGRQTVSARFADPLRVFPIRIRAHALGDGVPSRDLLVSPDHGLLVADILIQAGALVNGNSIVRETKVPETFTYYHVELDDHSLIFAENTPVETFVDNVDRLAFDNWREHEALYPEGKQCIEMRYPRAKAHRQVPRSIRGQLAARATILIGETQTVAA